MATLAPCLYRARTEVNKRWPVRDRGDDGWVGDKAHQLSGPPEKGGSDHNVNKRGLVNAIDVDVDGIDAPLLVAKAIKHPSTNYVIYNRRIWSRSRGFASREYTGKNPHTKHVHISILQTPAAENSTVSWNIADINTTPAPAEGSWAQRLVSSLPVLEESPMQRGTVRKLQALLNAAGSTLLADGVFGQKTLAAVGAFQKTRGLQPDGIVGPKTWSALVGDLATTRDGAQGMTVRQIQWLLNLHNAALKVDGVFGPATTHAVRLYQAAFGLTADGVVGPVTWTALLTR